ncbi:hypothetical protein CH267_22070 [Rhodococcus sp. 06-621-2]|nr:hypothetical protein CH267_22070 [Rhodococcus sp. 06-621-2]
MRLHRHYLTDIRKVVPVEGSGHRSLARADRILDLVARSGAPLTLSMIARGIDAPVSSTQDLVRELIGLGYLQMLGPGYVIGLRTHVLDLIAGTPRAVGMDHAALLSLSRHAQVPLTTAALVGRDVFYLDHAGPRAPSRIQTVADDHRPRPVLRTAAGRLLLALSDEAVRHRILADLTHTDPSAAQAFSKDVSSIRRDRIARSDGLADPDIAAVALPAEHTGVALVLTARRAPRGGRVPSLEVAARAVRQKLSEMAPVSTANTT